MKTKKGFISYASDDKKVANDLIQRLNNHFKAAKDFDFDIWQDTDILPSENWHNEIITALNACDFGLLLTSPAFFASDYINEHELIQFVPTKDGVINKRAIPVGLIAYDFKLINTKGLTEQQVYRRHDGKFYSQCAGSGKDQFINDLFRKIIKVMKKYPLTVPLTINNK